MRRNIGNLLTCFLIFALITDLSSAQQEPNNLISIEALPKAKKGFPVVIKVNVEGRQIVTYLSIQYVDLSVKTH